MITSRQNPLVARFRAASKRRLEGLCLVEGPTLLDEALRAGVVVEHLLYTRRGADHAATRRALGSGLAATEVSDELLAYACDVQAPQGVAALIHPPRTPLPSQLPPSWQRVVILDEVRDPGNLGTILRTCRAAFGAALVLVGACADPMGPKVLRASAGACFWLPIVELPDRQLAAAWLASSGLHLATTSVRQGVSCFAWAPTLPLGLVMGNEAHGVGEDLRQLCASEVHIPMQEGCESLNLAVATGVLLYAALQQTGAR